jgi:hypothetical protein
MTLSRVLLFALAAATALAADDPWNKVKELKSGTEIRVFKKGSTQSVLAKMDEANEERLLVVVKNGQVAIAKADIDRLDYRPSKPGTRLTTTTESRNTEPDARPAPPGFSSRTPGTSSSSSVNIGSKPDFETIYRRPAAPPKK